MRADLYNLYKQKETKKHLLQYLFLEITRQCNLSCLHCGSDCRSDKTATTLSLESWLSIIDYCSAAFSPELFFVITGGEPLAYSGLLEITNRLKEKNRKWGMVSNGVLLKKENLHHFIDNGMQSLTISLDGLEEAHNYLRNGPVFNKVVNAIETIGRSFLPMKDIVTCIYPKNISQLDELRDLVFQTGMTSWRLFQIFPSGRAKNRKELHLEKEQYDYLIRWIAENRKEYLKKGLQIDLSCEGYLPLKIDRQVRREPFFCRSGISMASILADGSITGCSNNATSFYQGNICKDDFLKLWDKGFAVYRNKQALNKGICEGCSHFHYCRGGSLHLWETKDAGPARCFIRQ